jgi:hypothetical protein
MLTPYYARLQTLQADGAAVTTNGVDTSMLLGAAKYTLPASFLQFIGQDLYIRAAGRISTTTGTNTITFKVMFNATPIAVFNSGALTLVASQTNQTWMLMLNLTVRSIGSGTTATLMGIGTFEASVALVANGSLMMPQTAPAVGTGFDSTAANLVDLTANWSATGNSLTCHQFCLDAAL